MGDVTIYLARKLYLPSGDVLRKYVVAVSDGRVLEWYPFETERHSMLLVEGLSMCRAADGTLRVASLLL